MKKIFILITLILVFTGCSSKYDDEIEIKFKSDLKSDYFWEYTINDFPIVKIDENFELDECEEDKCMGTRYFNITGLSEGKTSITFSYTNGYDIMYEAIYSIEVFDDLTLDETHSGSYFN